MNFAVWLEERRWDAPQDGDEITGQASSCNAAQVADSTSSEYLYATGYIEAARALAIHAFAKPRNNDFLVFPIAYLYRHHVELSLKKLAEDVRDLTDQGDPQRLSHELEPLWDEVRSGIKAVGQDFPEEELDGVVTYIRQLHGLDKTGETFRFATRKDGRPHLAVRSQIDIRTLAESMEKLASYLDYISARLELMTEHKAEMESYKAESEGP